jgi:hypothetical protein
MTQPGCPFYHGLVVGIALAVGLIWGPLAFGIWVLVAR